MNFCTCSVSPWRVCVRLWVFFAGQITHVFRTQAQRFTVFLEIFTHWLFAPMFFEPVSTRSRRMCVRAFFFFEFGIPKPKYPEKINDSNIWRNTKKNTAHATPAMFQDNLPQTAWTCDSWSIWVVHLDPARGTIGQVGCDTNITRVGPYRYVPQSRVLSINQSDTFVRRTQRQGFGDIQVFPLDQSTCFWLFSKHDDKSYV